MKKIILISITSLLILVGCTNNSRIINISNDKYYNMVIEHPDYVYIDVRTAEEYNDYHLEPFTINYDYYQLNTYKDEINKLDKNQPIVLICRSGNRSMKAAKYFEDLGFLKIYNIQDGINSIND